MAAGPIVPPILRNRAISCPPKLRRVKNASVYENLKSMHSFRSDQGAVWDEIAIQAHVNKVSPVTGAMKDVLEAKQEDLDAFLEHFPIVADQNGLLVLVNGEVVGLDMVSRAAAFMLLHPKLIRSYVMDALTEKPIKAKETSRDKADAFLKKILPVHGAEIRLRRIRPGLSL